MSGRGKGDGRGGSGSSSQRDERPPLQRFRQVPPPPEARPMSGGEASSSSTTEERTYQTPPPDMNRGPPWPAAQPAPPPPPANVGMQGETVPLWYPPPPPKAETEGGTVPAFCPPPPPPKVVLVPKKGPKPPPPPPSTETIVGKPKGKPPPPNAPPLKADVAIRGLPTGPGAAGFADPREGDAEDLWCPNKILREDLERMIDHVPEMYANYRGMELDYTQSPLWRVTEEETYKPRSNKTVEDWLTSLRKKNLKEKEEVATIARRIKEGFWKMHGGRASRDLRNRAGDKLTEQHSVARSIRFSPDKDRPLPAEEFRAPLLEKINRAMKNLDESSSHGIVLLVGGTGCGKSSVSPPALYVDTILEAHGRDRKGNPFLPSELRPGGRVLITEPRKALTRSMVSHLKNMNREHDFLFGYQYAGASSSPNHDEAILYMTDGIAVAHLMAMVSDVMTMVHREQAYPSREGVLDPSVIEGIQRIPWDPEFPLICH
eukprot:5582199-Amphidinium_carterae.2